MRGLADLRFRLLHRQHVAHRAVEPGAAVGGAGPCALVQPGEHHHVGADQTRFEQAENAEWRRAAALAAHRKAMQPVAQDGRGAPQVAGPEEARLLPQQRKGIGQDVAALTRPEGFAGNRLTGHGKAIEMLRQSVGRALDKRRQHFGDALRLGDRLLPLRVGDVLHGERQATSVLRLGGKAQRMRQLADVRCADAGAEQCEFDEAGEVARLVRRQAEGGKLVAQQGREWFGSETLEQRLEQQVQQRGAAEADQRLAGGIIDGDVPPPEFHLDAPRQLAVRRDEAGRAARRFEAFAQDEGGCHRLFLGRARLDEFNALHGLGHARFLPLQCGMPEMGRLGRTHQLAGEPGAGAGLRADLRHHLPRGVEAGEQLLHRVLRMGGAHRSPACLVHDLVETGQHHRAIGQAGNGLEQRAGGWDGTRRACGNEGPVGAGEVQPLRLAPEDRRAPGLRPHGLFFRQALGIFLARDRQEFEDCLAMARRLNAIELGNLRHLHVLGLERVEQFRQ